MNMLSVEQRVRVLAALTEGTSVRATVRMTGTAKGTILKLLEEIGTACADYQHRVFVNLNCARVEVDEVWAFVGAKDRNAPKNTRGSIGDVWTWTAIDADTKLMPCYYVGRRDARAADCFLGDLRSRMSQRIQLTSDGHNVYLRAVEQAFGWNGVDYAQLVKTYGPAPEAERRYSPPICTGATRERVMGDPDMSKVSTSYVERSNLTIRMSSRRFTRLTNAFSKKVENHRHAVALFTMHYNFCRSHQTLTKANGGIHKTPAMAAGLTDHVWTLAEVVGLLAGASAEVAA